jgi:hypothetical protein
MPALLRAGNSMQSVPLCKHVVHLLEDRLEGPPFPRRENIDLALELLIKIASELELALPGLGTNSAVRRIAPDDFAGS